MHDGKKKYVKNCGSKREKKRSISDGITLRGRIIVNTGTLDNVN
jgi:hypothetical protein